MERCFVAGFSALEHFPPKEAETARSDSQTSCFVMFCHSHRMQNVLLPCFPPPRGSRLRRWQERLQADRFRSFDSGANQGRHDGPQDGSPDHHTPFPHTHISSVCAENQSCVLLRMMNSWNTRSAISLDPTVFYPKEEERIQKDQ